jgi:hypothetical protein
MAGPLFLQFTHPKLVDYNEDVLLKLPETYEGLEDVMRRHVWRDKLRSLPCCGLMRRKLKNGILC